MNARDELAEVIRSIDGPATLGGLEVADAILAWIEERYTPKPRTITSVEELDALPGGAIIRDAKGFGWQKYNKPISDKPAWFPATRDHGFYYSSNFVDDERTPITVLFEPEAQA